MSYLAPPQVVTSLHIATSGVANSVVTTAFLAAPGAGAAFLIRAVWAMANRGNAAGALIEVHFQDVTAAKDLWGTCLCASGGSGSDGHDWQSPGILLTANGALSIVQSSSVATQGLDVGVAYDLYAF